MFLRQKNQSFLREMWLDSKLLQVIDCKEERNEKLLMNVIREWMINMIIEHHS